MALDLVQYWADSFQTRRDLPSFNQTHLLLKRAGIAFPPRRKDEPPIVFKGRARMFRRRGRKHSLTLFAEVTTPPPSSSHPTPTHSAHGGSVR